LTEKANILVVDDEIGPRESVRMILSPFYNVYTAEQSVQAMEILSQTAIDLVTLDLKMPGLTGIKLLEKAKQHDQDIEAIIITGYGSLDTAVEGLRLGAFDYISKPFDVNHILSQVSRALQRRRARLRLKEIRTDFITNVSHELRTPLSVVMGFINLLLDKSAGDLTEKQKNVIEKVYKNSEELLALIDNVLWITYLNSGDAIVMLEEFDVKTIVQECVSKHENTLKGRGVVLSIQLPSTELRILSDQKKVLQIFQNLFHNALKFTAQGQITVKVDLSEKNDSVVIEIIDTGIGFPQNEIDSMVEPFRQLDSSSRREFSGLGLGLTISRQLTDLLGGTLHITSEPGIGTCIVLTLPVELKDQRDNRPH
jgi:signal transduction histidine kinase